MSKDIYHKKKFILENIYKAEAETLYISTNYYK
jgi:hypothetical protein